MTPEQRLLEALKAIVAMAEGPGPTLDTQDASEMVSIAREAIEAYEKGTTSPGCFRSSGKSMARAQFATQQPIYTDADMRECWKQSRINALHPPFSGKDGYDTFIATQRSRK